MLEWDEFLRCAKEIERLSAAIDDGWYLVVEKKEPGYSYLEKKTLEKVTGQCIAELERLHCGEVEEEDTGCAPTELDGALKCVYNVVYSLSYGVPVLYFNVWRRDGSLLPLSEVRSRVPEMYREQLEEQWWSTVTQQEHPIRGIPFFQLHPCKTEQMMQQVTASSQGKFGNYLVTWLSTVGPLAGLQLSTDYSKLVVSEEGTARKLHPASR